MVNCQGPLTFIPFTCNLRCFTICYCYLLVELNPLDGVLNGVLFLAIVVLWCRFDDLIIYCCWWVNYDSVVVDGIEYS